MSEALTIFRTTPTPRGAPRYATKQFIWTASLNEWRSIAYDAGASFTVEERPVASLDDVAGVLDGVRRDPRAFIVRGELLPDVRRQIAGNPEWKVRRAKKEGKKGGAPSLAECSRQWLMVDVDGYPLPAWGDLASDPEAIIERAIGDLLPECFQDVRCFWQLSSSAGFKAGLLKVHLFFWLSQPASNEELKAFLKVHAPAVDPAPFNAAQPHYIADPIIEGGHDPLPRRTGWVKGLEDAVELPPLDLAQLRAAIQQRRERVASGAGLDASAARTINGALALLGDDPDHEGWHQPLRRATWLYAAQTAEKNRDDDALKDLCRAAIKAAAERETARRHAAADLDRLGSDAYLDAMIEGAFARIETDRSDAPAGMSPFHEAPSHTATDARQVVRAQLAEVLQDAARWHAAPESERGAPRHVGIAVDVGAGKSRIGREQVAPFSAMLRDAELPHRVLWLTPTIRLGAEAEEHFGDMPGVMVAVHRGREQPDPLEPGQAMCLDLDAVKLAQVSGENVEAAVCGGAKPGAPRCPFFDACGYQRQSATVAAADVVIAAHEAAFHLPRAARKNVALTVMDEAWWQDGLKVGRAIPVEGLADSVLQHPVWQHVPGGRQVEDMDATNDLHTLRSRLERALMAAGDGYLSRTVLEAEGLTVELCSQARKHEYNRKRENLMRPGMSAAARKEAAELAGVNAQVLRFTALWTVLADLLAADAELTGRAEMLWKDDRDGVSRWTVALNTITEIVATVKERPVLLLDATMPAELVRAYLPRLEAAPAVRVKAPFMEVRQVRGGWGKTTLLPGRVRIEADEAGQPKGELPRILAELRDFVAGQTRGERALVITYKDAEAAFSGLPGVEVGHFNDVAGRDEWRDVRHLFVIGRPRPPSQGVQALAAALTGNPVEVAESHREARGVRMADGTGGTVEVRAYANPAAAAVSAAITDAEVVQAIGRARGINRGEADPVRVWLLADVVTPLVVDELLDWRDLAPSAVERMACRGVVLANSADASRAYPDLFPTSEAARKAFQRAGVGKEEVRDILLRRILLGDCPGLRPLRFTYRPKGQGQQRRGGWARPDMDPEDLWRWLEDRAGELAEFTPEAPPPDPAPPEPPPPGPGKRAPAPSEPAAGVVEPASAPEPAWAGPGEPDPTCSEVAGAARSNAGGCGEPAGLGGYLHPEAVGLRPICRIGLDLDGFTFWRPARVSGFQEQYAPRRAPAREALIVLNGVCNGAGVPPPAAEFRPMYAPAREPL